MRDGEVEVEDEPERHVARESLGDVGGEGGLDKTQRHVEDLHDGGDGLHCLERHAEGGLNIEIFKAPRVGGVDVYELLAVDVAAMTVLYLLSPASSHLSVEPIILI